MHLALLRGVNVGGKNRLSMAELVRVFADAGCVDVSTYIQSGNVLFRAPTATIAQLPDALSARIRTRFALDVPVILRSRTEFDDVVAANPFLAGGADPATLYVGFLGGRPTASRLATLDGDRSPPDEFRVVGREIHLRLPNGAARTKLTNAYFDRALATVSTFRNWRTVVELARRLVI
jgi:uncharacterized protein (DUF1697 family)